ncbi:MAG: D-tyrosyl-tRNA(Tyr) deacylase [Clostridia bacterium]|nr:D-aminoacyl-tRNA deacylase [Candidatus Pelethousia sp.]NCB30214.1 D-tyrosyl-tRNA(Tyr) deacylase [Clostridia bacterium]
MRAVVQRVSRASVTISSEVCGKIGPGFLVLLGVEDTDGPEDLAYICDKILGLRVFEDAAGKMNLDILQTGGKVLLISQFTLYGDARHGRRPSFIKAARPETAIPLYEEMVERLRRKVPVETGRFGAEMQVELINDGPVTILLESKKLF